MKTIFVEDVMGFIRRYSLEKDQTLLDVSERLLDALIHSAPVCVIFIHLCGDSYREGSFKGMLHQKRSNHIVGH